MPLPISIRSRCRAGTRSCRRATRDSIAARSSPSPASSRSRPLRRAGALRSRARGARRDRRWPRGRCRRDGSSAAMRSSRERAAERARKARHVRDGRKIFQRLVRHQLVGDARGDRFITQRRARREPLPRERRHREAGHQLGDARSRDAERRAFRVGDRKREFIGGRAGRRNHQDRRVDLEDAGARGVEARGGRRQHDRSEGFIRPTGHQAVRPTGSQPKIPPPCRAGSLRLS